MMPALCVLVFSVARKRNKYLLYALFRAAYLCQRFQWGDLFCSLCFSSQVFFSSSSLCTVMWMWHQSAIQYTGTKNVLNIFDISFFGVRICAHIQSEIERLERVSESGSFAYKYKWLLNICSFSLRHFFSGGKKATKKMKNFYNNEKCCIVYNCRISNKREKPDVSNVAWTGKIF